MKSKILRNLIKIFVPNSLKVAMSSIEQILESIEIKIMGVFIAIRVPSNVLRIGVVTFTIKF